MKTTLSNIAFIFLTMLSMDSLCYHEEIIWILMSTRSNTSLITTSNLYKDEHSASITKVWMMEITPSSLTEPQFFFFFFGSWVRISSRVFALKQLQGSNRSLIRFMEVVLVCNIPTSPFYTLLISNKCMQFINDSLPIFRNFIKDFQSIGTWYLHCMQPFGASKTLKNTLQRWNFHSQYL